MDPLLSITKLCSQPAKLLYRFLNGFRVFDVRVHAVFFKVQLLCQYQNLSSDFPGNDHDPVAIRCDNVAGIHSHSVTLNRSACACNPIMPGGRGRDDAVA